MSIHRDANELDVVVGWSGKHTPCREQEVKKRVELRGGNGEPRLGC